MPVILIVAAVLAGGFVLWLGYGVLKGLASVDEHDYE